MYRQRISLITCCIDPWLEDGYGIFNKPILIKWLLWLWSVQGSMKWTGVNITSVSQRQTEIYLRPSDSFISPFACMLLFWSLTFTLNCVMDKEQPGLWEMMTVVVEILLCSFTYWHSSVCEHWPQAEVRLLLLGGGSASYLRLNQPGGGQSRSAHQQEEEGTVTKV